MELRRSSIIGPWEYAMQALKLPLSRIVSPTNHPFKLKEHYTSILHFNQASLPSPVELQDRHVLCGVLALACGGGEVA
jgi:hypothetical protein